MQVQSSTDSTRPATIDTFNSTSIDSTPMYEVDEFPEGNYYIGSWTYDHYIESFTVETKSPDTRSDEYDEDYRRKKAIECQGLHREEDLITYTFCPLHPADRARAETDSLFVEACGEGTCFNRVYRADKDKSIDINTSTSIDNNNNTSIDISYKPLIAIHQPSTSELSEQHKLDYGYLTPNEFGIFRDPKGQERAMANVQVKLFIQQCNP